MVCLEWLQLNLNSLWFFFYLFPLKNVGDTHICNLTSRELVWKTVGQVEKALGTPFMPGHGVSHPYREGVQLPCDPILENTSFPQGKDAWQQTWAAVVSFPCLLLLYSFFPFFLALVGHYGPKGRQTASFYRWALGTVANQISNHIFGKWGRAPSLTSARNTIYGNANLYLFSFSSILRRPQECSTRKRELTLPYLISVSYLWLIIRLNMAHMVMWPGDRKLVPELKASCLLLIRLRV